MKHHTEKFYDGLAVLVLIICGIGLLIRSFYSFSWSDESFYLALAHRFWLGERIIVDEWHRTQLSSLLLLPFYALYQRITGGNEGIYLYFRLLYWGLSLFTTLFSYYKLRKRNSCSASLISVLLYFLYSRANIGGMSYYNLPLTCMVLVSVMLYGQVCENKANKAELYICGVLLSLTVISNPYLVFFYGLSGICMIVCKRYRFLRREVLTVLLGMGTVGIIFAVYVLKQVSLREFLFYIPYILSDPEMQKTNLLFAVPLVLARIIWRYKWTIWLSVLLTGYICFRKRRPVPFKNEEIGVLLAVDLGVFLVNIFLSLGLLGCVNMAVVLFAVPVICIWKGLKEIAYNSLMIFGVSGTIMVLAFSFSSNTGLDAMTIGAVIVAMGAVLFVFQLEGLKNRPVLMKMTTAVLTISVIQLAVLRICSVYRDAPISDLKVQLSSGPAKFLYTTQEHARQYDGLRNAISQYVREGDRVFYSKSCCWGYLCTDNRYGAFSAWRIPLNSPSLEAYYKLDQEKIPTCVFVLAPSCGDYASSMIQAGEKEENPNENCLEGYLYDYMTDNHYELIRLDCASVYRSR